MEFIEIRLQKKRAQGFIIPLGPANLVAIKTDVGLVGCGAFDVAALDSFSYPAAKVRPSLGPSIEPDLSSRTTIVTGVRPGLKKLSG